MSTTTVTDDRSVETAPVGAFADGGHLHRRARRRATLLVVAALVALAGAVTGLRALAQSPSATVTADFAETPGLYVGNHVDVLGIPVGTITAIRPGVDDVAVAMSVPRSLALPADVHAVLEAPDVISDRYVALTPVYRGGPRLGNGATIPLSRTAVPLSLDQILSTFDQLARALGPTGANRNGAVSRLVHQLAVQLNGNGPDLHAAVSSLGAAFSSLTGKGSDLTSTLDNLGSLTSSLVKADGTYEAFASTASSVAQTLASDRSSLGQALTTLEQALGQIATFVKDNASALHGSIGNLETTIGALDQDQQSLAQAWDVAPLSFQNFANAIDTSAPGGPALVTTLDPTPDSSTLVNEICGNPGIRGTNLLLNGPSASELDVACAAAFGIAALPTPPNAPSGPDLTLQALVGGS
jgi:virulence factor Mce-like protein